MLALAEKQMLIQALGQVVYDEVQTAIKPLQERMGGVEQMLGDMPVPRDGKDGRDGTNGKDGAAGRDGIDGAMGLPGVNGRDGVDGKDGYSVTLDHVLPSVRGLVGTLG